MLVYLVTNTVNNKVYVGKFVGEHVKDRWQRHLRDAVRGDCYLYRAMRKYGAQTFEISVLSSGIGSKQDLADQEKMYIAQYRANIAGYGYNMTPGGDGGCGLTESARKKVSEAQMGAKNHRYGKTNGQLQRSAVSKAVRELDAKSHPMLGKERSGDTRSKISQGLLKLRLGRHHLAPQGTAWCSGHQEYLPTDEFYRCNCRPSGFRNYCKKCQK